MKRVLILLVTLLLAIPLALGIMAGLAFHGARAEHIPRPSVTMLDKEMPPCGYDWRTPVFGGLVYRDFVKDVPGRIQDIGELEGSFFNISVPNGYETRATLTRMGDVVWSGRAAELSSYELTDNGRYRIQVECIRPVQSDRGYGSLFYQGAFNVTVDPRYEASDSWVTQGDVLALRIYNLGSTLTPHAEGDLGEVYFFTNQVGQATAYIPIGYDYEPRSYVLFAGAGHSNWEIPLRVTDGDFSTRRIDTKPESPPFISGSDAPQEYPDYQETIAPLLSQRDGAQYWNGIFQHPVLGEITNAYGTLTYINDAKEPLRHAGIDIAADKGTAVGAANNGRVVLASHLESTGNTVVIEHGGGLKSFYYHLDTLAVEPNAMVETGEIIGTVGRTGTCEETHLHFEIRLGESALNPTMLLNGTSRLYHFN